MLLLRLVYDPPLGGGDGLEVPHCPQDPHEGEGPNDRPDYAHGVEALLDGDTLAPLLLALPHHGGAVAGVVSLGPARADGAEPQGTG